MSFGYKILGFGSGGLAFTYIEATGGDSIATDGDYKVHTFTNPGTFTVASVGDDRTPSTFRDKISYVVVGGGGSAGGRVGAGAGHGGAGGFRANDATAGGSFTPVSPLAAPVGAFTVSASPGSYPISIGGGGSPVSGHVNGNAGGTSTGFSIASSGGGLGGQGNHPNTSGNGGAGSSGGGGGGDTPGTRPGGPGNNPSTSPPQGQPGGAGYNPGAGGSGGGAGGAGASTWPVTPGPGTPHGITGSDVTYSEGGPSSTMGGQPGFATGPGLDGGVVIRYRFQGVPA